MFAGHLAAGLVLKNVERRISLGWLFFATLFHDFFLGILVFLGVEHIHIPANFEQVHYMTFTFPYSHGLTASIVWSFVAFGIIYAASSRWTSKERIRAGAAMGLAVFSHFVFDWLVHIPELPVFGETSFKIGLGLWNNLPLALAFEAALVGAGFVIYLIKIKPKTKLARFGMGGLLLFTTTITVLGMWLVETPSPSTGAALTWILQPFLICGLAFWLDKDGTLIASPQN